MGYKCEFIAHFFYLVLILITIDQTFMKKDIVEQPIENPQQKQDWSKPELTLIGINNQTLGVNHSGGDFFGSDFS